MAERIRPAPNGAKRAKSRLIQHVQDFKIRVDCFSAFDMHNRCQQAVLHRLLDIIDVAADANAALRLPLDTEKERHHGEDSPLRRHQFKGRRQRGAAANVLRRCFAIRANRPSKYPPAKPGALVLEPLKAACPCRTRQSVPSTLWNAPHLMTC